MIQNEEVKVIDSKEEPSNRPVLFLMCGLPFSGKSFLSEKIAQSLNTGLISYDKLWTEMKDKTGQDLSWEQLSKIAEDRITQSLTSGASITYDTLNDTVGNREKLRQLAKVQNAEVIVIFTNTPPEIIEQRRKINEEAQIRHSVAENNFQESLTRFEPPVPEEHAIEFTPNDNLDSWLQNLQTQIK